MIACSAGYAVKMDSFHVAWHTACNGLCFIPSYVWNCVSYLKETTMIVWSGQAQTEQLVELASSPQNRQWWRSLFHPIPN